MTAPTRWSTSSLGQSAHTQPGELSELGDHLGQCTTLSGWLYALRCGADAAHRFIASRIVTTLAGSALLVAAALLVW